MWVYGYTYAHRLDGAYSSGATASLSANIYDAIYYQTGNYYAPSRVVIRASNQSAAASCQNNLRPRVITVTRYGLDGQIASTDVFEIPSLTHNWQEHEVVFSNVFALSRMTVNYNASCGGSGTRNIVVYFNWISVDMMVCPASPATPTPSPTPNVTNTPAPTLEITSTFTPAPTPYAGDGTPRAYATQDRWDSGGGSWSDCSVPEYIDETPAVDFTPTNPICSESNPDCDFDNPDYQCYAILPHLDVDVVGLDIFQITGTYACIQWLSMPTLAILGVSIPLDFLLLLPVFYLIRRLMQL